LIRRVHYVGGVHQRAVPGTGWRLFRLVLVLAVVFVASVQGAVAQPASTFSSTCHGVTATGCIEVRTTQVTGGAVPASATVRELQMNLCGSGMASCYRNGRALTEAARLIARYAPSVVTLNEVCADNVVGVGAAIPSAMVRLARQQGDGTVFALFTPAVNRFTDMPYRCVDGDLYGIGMVGRAAAPAGTPEHHRYQHQYTGTDEERVAVCAEVGAYDVCTTHLESDDPAVAISQCHELMAGNGFVSDFRRATGERPTEVAGDFNLAVGRAPDIRGCVPSGWTRDGDGIVQHVMAVGLGFASKRIVHMRYTDHPALLVDLTPGSASR
jgi:hypothetical protein